MIYKILKGKFNKRIVIQVKMAPHQKKFKNFFLFVKRFKRKCQFFR